MSQVHVPFTPEQVASLNDYQHSGVFHEFTCGNPGCHHPEGGHSLLVATPEGWRCSREGCDYRQGWAWSWMTDRSWEAARVVSLEAAFAKLEAESPPFEFRPFLSYNADGDIIQCYLEVESFFGKWIMPGLTLHMGRDSGRIVGFTVEGVEAIRHRGGGGTS